MGPSTDFVDRFTRPWMRLTLRLAGIYNVLWGAAVVALPNTTLRLLGADPEQLTPIVAPLWQGVGMIVGVYGVGYWIAASNPTRHWPIVLVGFMGKVFGPIGVVDAVFLKGSLPASFFWTNLTNDLIWIVPFALILLAAYRRCVAERGVAFDDSDTTDPQALRRAMDSVRTSQGRTLADATDEAPTLVVFLRHFGCTFCREAAADLGRDQSAIEDSGAKVVLVHMSASDERADSYFARYGLDGVEHARDPERSLYRAFGLAEGTLGQLFGAAVWVRGIDAGLLQRHFVGRLEGDGFQMPGAFLVHKGEVLRAFRHRDAGDRPDYAAMVCDAPQARPAT